MCDVMLFQSKLCLNANEHPDNLPTQDAGSVSGQKKQAYHSVLQLQSRNTEEQKTAPADTNASKSICC